MHCFDLYSYCIWFIPKEISCECLDSISFIDMNKKYLALYHCKNEDSDPTDIQDHKNSRRIRWCWCMCGHIRSLCCYNIHQYL